LFGVKSFPLGVEAFRINGGESVGILAVSIGGRFLAETRFFSGIALSYDFGRERKRAAAFP
jgi:hypothetical protein